MRYRFPATVTDIFERKEKRHVSGVKEAAVFETYSAGWYIQLDRAVSLYVGTERPQYDIGEKIQMTIQRSQ